MTIRAMSAHPTQPDIVDACIAPVAVYRSDDVAQTGRRIDRGANQLARVMTPSLHPTNPGVVYFVTRAGQVIGTEGGDRSGRNPPLSEDVREAHVIAGN